MPQIVQEIEIHAPIEICFDLSRSIDLHMISTGKTKEKAIAGKTSGLIELNETVTWRAKHLGVNQTLTSKITALKYPKYFVDEMVAGVFKSLRHQHIFESKNDHTIITDKFEFESPFGIFGKIFNHIFLTSYLKGFITDRNKIIKEYAETDKWKTILNKE
ncbi:MAG: SRPBCC family protein [Fimbriimonadaceae bacterium]|nr:SRPBCC family protein [Chitinophagales bacterium]